MQSQSLFLIKKYTSNKDNLTLWMNNLLVLYAFLLPISQTIKATIFTFILLLFFIRGDVVNQVKSTLRNKVVRSFLYLFLIYVIGLLWTDDMSSGINAINSIKYGLYLIIFYSIVDGHYIDKVITAFILGMLVSELTSYGILFEIMPWRLEIGEILFYKVQSPHDPSPFLNHIHYGVALSFLVVLLGQKIVFSSEHLYVKLIMSLFVVSATANIFVTGGRTGYMTFIVLMLILPIFYLKKYVIGVLSALILILSIAYTSSPIFQTKFVETKQSIEQLFTEEPNFNTSLGARAGMYYYAFEIIKDNLIFGVGTGDSMNEMHKVTPQKWDIIHSLTHEHNQYLSTLLKLGLVGLFVFLNVFYQIFTYKQEEKDLRFIQIFITLAVGIGILTTQFNLRFFLPLLVVMLSITLINRSRVTIQNIELNDKKQAFQIIGVGIIFSFASLIHQLI